MKITKKMLKRIILEAMQEELALGPVMAALDAAVEAGELDPDVKDSLAADVSQMPPQAVEDIEALMSMRLADVHQIVELVDYAYDGDGDFEYILHNLGLPDLEDFGPVGKRIQQMVLARGKREGEAALASYDDEYDY